MVTYNYVFNFLLLSHQLSFPHSLVSRVNRQHFINHWTGFAMFGLDPASLLSRLFVVHYSFVDTPDKMKKQNQEIIPRLFANWL